ncbi:hypothetical protein Mapa_003192 [Marchantia paleacea]|nr:hypothetical protein Mapa_003192 [Marchantia paleacea]
MLADVQTVLHSPDTVPGCRIELVQQTGSHGIRSGSRLVHELKSSHVGEVVVGVPDSGNPLEECVSSFVVCRGEEPGRAHGVSCELLVGELAARSSMKVENDVKACIAGHFADFFQVWEPSSREVLVGVNEVFFHPEPEWNSDGVEAVALDLINVGLGDPRAPVRLERIVCSRLPQVLYTLPFVIFTSTAHGGPLIVHHPWLHDEKASQVHASDWILIR